MVCANGLSALEKSMLHPQSAVLSPKTLALSAAEWSKCHNILDSSKLRTASPQESPSTFPPPNPLPPPPQRGGSAGRLLGNRGTSPSPFEQHSDYRTNPLLRPCSDSFDLAGPTHSWIWMHSSGICTTAAEANIGWRPGALAAASRFTMRGAKGLSDSLDPCMMCRPCFHHGLENWPLDNGFGRRGLLHLTLLSHTPYLPPPLPPPRRPFLPSLLPSLQLFFLSCPPSPALPPSLSLSLFLYI